MRKKNDSLACASCLYSNGISGFGSKSDDRLSSDLISCHRTTYSSSPEEKRNAKTRNQGSNQVINRKFSCDYQKTLTSSSGWYDCGYAEEAISRFLSPPGREPEA